MYKDCVIRSQKVLTFIEYICGFNYRKASREGQPKRIMGGWESSALIGWHGNTDFFVLLHRERRQGILGITGMMTGWKHTLTHILETGARLSHIKIQGRISNRPQWRAAERELYSLSPVSKSHYLHLYKSLLLSCIIFTCFLSLLSSSVLSSPFLSFPFVAKLATQTAREIRLALCGPDICSRRQASCIPRIGAAREGGNEQGGELERGDKGRSGRGGRSKDRRKKKGVGEWILYEPAVSFPVAV